MQILFASRRTSSTAFRKTFAPPIQRAILQKNQKVTTNGMGQLNASIGFLTSPELGNQFILISILTPRRPVILGRTGTPDFLAPSINYSSCQFS
jgi:hypothetical protein